MRSQRSNRERSRGKSQNSKGLLLFNFELLLLNIFFFLLPSVIIAQNINVTATLDTNAILIGQQTKLKLRAEYSTNNGAFTIDFPKIADTIIKQIEVVSRSKIATFCPDSNDLERLAQQQTFVITSFDSGYYAIPPFRFIVNGDTIKAVETEALLLSVNTVAVDTTKNIKDIKPPIEVPFSWKEYLPYIYWGIGGLAVLAGTVLLLRNYLKKRKAKPIVPEIIVPKIPPHVTALERLEKLKEEKLWQQGKLKQYHSEISEILRQYIEHRFYIPAMEQVTDEILYAFRTADAPEEQKMKLRHTLILADLVKFAKELPLPNENEQSWLNAYEFVITTKKEAAVAESPNSPQQPATNKAE